MSASENKTVLLIGSGPTSIGQSGECDQGAARACQALTQSGYRVVVVSSNPDGISSGADWAAKTYLEPLTQEIVSEIISKERPQGLLAGFGGRAGLDLAVKLHHNFVLAKHQVALWGTPAENLACLLDRDALQAALAKIDISAPAQLQITSDKEALDHAKTLGYPVVLRCDDPDLIPDGILVFNQEELIKTITPIKGEPSCNLTMELCLRDWRQIELEILRDCKGQIKLAAAVEYMDSAGIHPGDSIAVCPAQTLTAKFLDQLFEKAKTVAEFLNIIGNATIRLAYCHRQDNILILAVHPRYTRTSAFAGRMMGIVIEDIICKLSAGQSVSQACKPNLDKTGVLSQDAPIGVKWPVWDFTSLAQVQDRLGPKMQASGHAFGIGANFAQALQKAARSATPHLKGAGLAYRPADQSKGKLLNLISSANSKRMLYILEAFRQNIDTDTVSKTARMHSWFIKQVQELADIEKLLQSHDPKQPDTELLVRAKSAGFTIFRLAQLTGESVRKLKHIFDTIDCCRNWKPLKTSNIPDGKIVYGVDAKQAPKKPEPNGSKILILGSGPHRIGQGSECDFGVFEAAAVCEQLGHKALVVNDNLTSVTTGMAIKGNVFIDPLCIQDILEIIDHEKPSGVLPQFSGPLNQHLINTLEEHGVQILGSPAESRKLLANRVALWDCIRDLGIVQPTAVKVQSTEEAMKKAQEIGFPLILRSCQPRENSINLVTDATRFKELLLTIRINADEPLILEQFLEYAIEAQAEVLCDGKHARVAAILEHIELAGVNATDSALVIPPYSLSPRHIETMSEYAEKIAVSTGITGLLNVRFAIYRDSVYVLDAEYGICRNLGLVTRSAHIPIARMATQLILGHCLADLKISTAALPYFFIRSAVFAFHVFPETDPLLGADTRATGEVAAFGDSYGMAYYKALDAAGYRLPTDGAVLITVTDEDKQSMIEPARVFQEMGFKLMSTKGTQALLANHGINSKMVRKLGFARPDLLDEIKNGRVQLVINTSSAGQSQIDDSYIRKAAIRYRIANITTPASAVAVAKGIAARKKGFPSLKALQDYAAK
ncbi:MAG: carbamoyl-phosphate synthase large subunit [Desulfobacteraceae bacterium]|nr:carbamoyl-phosphate synthase large subunit [Desulfobacteraceae bacterium]